MDEPLIDRVAASLEKVSAMRMVRWAVAYAAAAWLLLQAAVLLADVYQSGPDLKRAVVAVLAAGFPAILFVAWALDSRSSLRKPAALLGVLFSTGVAFVLYQALDRRPPPAQATLLVLAPADLRPEPIRADALADRIQEALLDALSRDRALKALSRSVAGAYDATRHTPADFARAQGATHFVEISIKDTTAGGGDPRLEITAQLIAVTDGIHVASYTKGYRAITTVGIERDLATILTGAFRIMVGPEDWASTGEVRSDSPEARTLFKQAEVNLRYGLGQPYDQSYAEALWVDPKFAQAAARRSLLEQGWRGSTERSAERAQLEQQFDHDPDFDFLTMGMWSGRGGEATAARFARDPVYLYSRAYITLVKEAYWEEPARDRRTGKPLIPKTRQAFELAIAADPGYSDPREHFAWALYQLGDFEGADSQLAELERLLPYTEADWSLYRIHARLAANGDLAEMRDRFVAHLAANPPAPSPGRSDNVAMLEVEHALAHLGGDLKGAIALGQRIGGDQLKGLTPDWGPLLQRRWSGNDEAAVTQFIIGERAKASAYATARLQALDGELRKDGGDPTAAKGQPWRWVLDRAFWRFIEDPRSLTAATFTELGWRMKYRDGFMGSPMRLAFLHAWSGGNARAVEVLKDCLANHLWCNAKLVARDPWWAPLYGDPGFEELLRAHGAVPVHHSLPRPKR